MDKFLSKKRPAPPTPTSPIPSTSQEVHTSSSMDEHGAIIAKCKLCNIELVNHKAVLEKHVASQRHLQLINVSNTNKKINLASNPENSMVKRAEFKLASMLAEHNLPFTLMDTLVPLIQNIIPGSNIAKGLAMGRTKTTAVITQILGPEFSTELVNDLKNPGCYFSLIMDETTDTISQKQCAITVIHCNKDFEIHTEFLDIMETDSSTAESLFERLKECIVSKNIPFSNLVGFSADTTNSMVGIHNSIFSRLKDELPDIACIKCSCHSIHLVASKACLHLPRSLEDTLRNIGSHFSRSNKRQKKLAEMQHFFGVDIHKILSPANTRWLSLKQCVDRVLEQLPALIPYFTAEVFEDPSKTTEEIISVLKSDLMIIYFEFMSYSLEILTDFNKLFQSDSPLLHRLKPEVQSLLKTINANYMKFSVAKSDPWTVNHQNPNNFLPLEKIYIGIAASASISSFLEKHPDDPAAKLEIDKVRKGCLQFYIEVVTQVKARFKFTDPIFQLIDMVDPCHAQSYEVKEVGAVIKRFPYLSKVIDHQKLDMEWKKHALLDHENLGLDNKLPAEQYWEKVFSLDDPQGNKIFPNLKVVIGLLLVLPFSNASVERTFSHLKKIKTQDRNCLQTEKISALMSTKNGVAKNGGCIAFEPSKAMFSKKIIYNNKK